MGKKEAKCPFSKLDCEDCRLFRSGIKLVGMEQKQEAYGDCVFHTIADNIEMTHRRTVALQAEMGELKNSNIFLAMAKLGDPDGAIELAKMVERHKKENQITYANA